MQSRANSLQYALQYVLEGKKYTEVLSEYTCAFVHRNRMTEDPQGLPTLLSIKQIAFRGRGGGGYVTFVNTYLLSTVKGHY